MMLATQCASGPLQGELTPPGDKSISHRSLIFSCLAQGESRVTGLLQSADVDATLAACSQLGMAVRQEDETLVLDGVGASGLSRPDTPLDMGNSGTAMRLLAGVLAAQPGRKPPTRSAPAGRLRRGGAGSRSEVSVPDRLAS